MGGIIINIDPVIFRLGGFELRWYSVMILLAVIAAVIIAVRGARKKDIPAEEILSFLPWVLVGGIIGARLFHVVDHWDYYAVYPGQIFQMQQGGLAIWGAMLGGSIAVVVYTRMRHLSLPRLADVMVPALIVAQIIGRFGCIINGDAAGGVTSLPWGFIYTHPNALIPQNLVGVPTHPYPVYEILWNILALTVLLRVSRHLKKDGLLFLAYLAIYGLGRFILSFVRQENIWFWGLQEAQVLAIGVMAVAMAALFLISRRTKVESLIASEK